MPKTPHWRILSFGLAAAAATALLWHAVQPREPVYQGRSLSDWLRELNPQNGAARYAAASEAIRAVGANGFPTYLKRLQAKDSPLKRLWANYAKKLGLKPPGRFAGDYRLEAIAAFHALGPLGQPALPMLRAMLDNENGAHEAAWATAAIGPPAAMILTSALTHTNVTVRIVAAESLGTLCTAPQITAPALVKCLGDPNRFVRANAAKSLGQIQAQPEWIVPALMISLADPDADARGYAAEALGNYRAQAKQAIPALRKALSDPDPNVRGVVQSALEKIDLQESVPQSARPGPGNSPTSPAQ